MRQREFVQYSSSSSLRNSGADAHQVHTIPRGTNETGVAQSVERAQLVEVDALVHEMDRHELHRTEPPIDPPDQLVHARPQVPVLLDVLPRGYCHLDKDDFPYPFRVFGEEDLEGLELLRYSFDEIQSVDADDDLDASESGLEFFESLDHFGLFEVLEAVSVKRAQDASLCITWRRISPREIGLGRYLLGKYRPEHAVRRTRCLRSERK